MRCGRRGSRARADAYSPPLRCTTTSAVRSDGERPGRGHPAARRGGREPAAGGICTFDALPRAWDWRAVSVAAGAPPVHFTTRIRNQFLPDWNLSE